MQILFDCFTTIILLPLCTHLQVVCDVARVNRCARRRHGAVEQVRQLLQQRKVLLALQRAAAGHDYLEGG